MIIRKHTCPNNKNVFRQIYFPVQEDSSICSGGFNYLFRWVQLCVQVGQLPVQVGSSACSGGLVQVGQFRWVSSGGFVVDPLHATDQHLLYKS